MKINIVIEKLEEDIEFPINEETESIKFTKSGIELNGYLHFWSDIMFVSIVNRGLLDGLKQREVQSG